MNFFNKENIKEGLSFFLVMALALALAWLVLAIGPDYKPDAWPENQKTIKYYKGGE